MDGPLPIELCTLIYQIGGKLQVTNSVQWYQQNSLGLSALIA